MASIVDHVTLYRFKNEDGSDRFVLGAIFPVEGENGSFNVFASSRLVPPLKGIKLTEAKTNAGEKCLRSELPVRIEYSNLRQSSQNQKTWFVNISAVTNITTSANDYLASLFDSEPKDTAEDGATVEEF
jgi:hypothetical protein